MGRYVGRQEKTGAEGSGDRCKNPIKRLRPRPLLQLPSHAFFVDSIEKTYNYDQVNPPLSTYQKSSPFIFTSCNIVVPTVDSLRGTGNSDRRFLQLLFFPVFPHTFHPEKTYNLEPPISIYLKNTSLYLEHYPFINIF